MATRIEPHTPAPTVTDVIKWDRPPHNFIKVNCDASVTAERCGIGCIARNNNGGVVFCAAKCVQSTSDIEVAEAEGIVWALELCLNDGFPCIWVDSDSLGVITKLKKRGELKGKLGVLLRKIEVLSSRFLECRWSYIRRQANLAADFLAK